MAMNRDDKRDRASKDGGVVERQTTKGMVEIVLRDKDGKKVMERKLNNMIVASGRVLLANLLQGEDETPLTHIAVGTGTTPPNAGDIVLETEFGGRKPFGEITLTEAAVATAILSSRAKDVLQVSARDPGGQGNELMITITEAKSGGKGRFDLMVISSPSEVKENLGGTKVEETLESFEDLSSSSTDDMYYFNVINRDSKLIRVAVLSEEEPPLVSDVPLERGCDTHLRFSTTFGYEEVNTNLSEAGMFNAEVGGRMYSRVVFTPIPKTNNLTLTLTWKVFF